MNAAGAIRACVFDAYGTLFDVDSVVRAHRARLGADAEALSALWRRKQLEYTWLRSLMGRYVDFRTVTAEALGYAMAAHGIGDTGLHADLMAAYDMPRIYSDVAPALARLRGRGLTLAILSNGAPAMLEAAISGAGLSGAFDAVLSVDPLGVYKPDPRVYRLAVEHLATAPSAILFHSSNGWDVAGAACFGFRTAWINRGGRTPERLPCGPDAVLDSLSGIEALLNEPGIADAR
ncbi:(S)-2-haloacid dehalogenase 4A [bacterium BMS3Bbin12]|nr:(S)-2-haloacid dehalogenase 4A [bacterium BMS3Abin12]GBE47295.1 (S)-2-haloacid dehalogenase 4A [bacterium BMS3Bbin12]GBE50686.1 (S)-2-haloacid dehalogenase 4A [bacterium BMS3Bbin13]HDK03274.1 haloacid dehalogenase type II [Gammaproteobacteria bacterium]HDO34148.1 haloacid dehalogenase type II [Chromatiales bacterium]